MKKNYVNNIPSQWEKELNERKKEILSYQRSWFWGGDKDQYDLMEKLLKRIHYLEDTVEELKQNKMKQTAVEWLVEQLINVDRPNHINNRMLAISKNSIQEKEFNELFKQAKEMEKEQIIDAYYYDPNCDEIKDDGEQYYNETFKSE